MPELTLKPQLKLIVFDDMAVLSDPETRSYYNFNPSAGPALEALAENLAQPAAADRLAQAYGVSPEVAGRDLERLIDQLEAEDLLTTVPAEPGRAFRADGASRHGTFGLRAGTNSRTRALVLSADVAENGRER